MSVQRSASFFCEEPDSKYSRLHGLYNYTGFANDDSALPAQWGSSHRPEGNEWE